MQVLVGVTIFLGSFLLFVVQPMMGRMLLPSFGGSAAVWSVCLAAYQLLLLAGYGYAHGLSRQTWAVQRRVHGILLALSVAWMFGGLALRGRLLAQVGSSAAPLLEVLGCVVVGVGLPYTLLASGSTLLQAWLARTGGGRGIYSLYAVSNLASMLGLFCHPLLLEPRVPIAWQWSGWTFGLLLYALLVVWTGWRIERREGGGWDRGRCAHDAPPPGDDLPAPLGRPWLWLALPACSSLLLVALTNHLSLDVEPMPLMWVVLLAAFLLSYMAGFSGWAHRALPLWAVLALSLLGVQTWHGAEAGRGWRFLAEMARGTLLLLALGAFLHSWLYRTRPPAGRLTTFYLAIAAGGAAGGLAGSLLAPVLFRRILEYPLALGGCAVLLGWFAWHWMARRSKVLAWAAALACLAIPLPLAWQAGKPQHGQELYAGRNFYGTLRVVTIPLRAAEHRLLHGSTLHGTQSFHPALSRRGTCYYGPNGGGLAVQLHPDFAQRPLRVGCIGLGAGTMCAYGRTNDLLRFLEINPLVARVAQDTNLFTYLADCPARVELEIGDARRTLLAEARRGEARYDVLIVDAYSGDAVPIHLATREAFALYLQRLAPDGILAVHVSNWHMDLLPLCKAVGREFRLSLLGAVSEADPAQLTVPASWVLLSHAPLPPVARPRLRLVDWALVRDQAAPTDECGSLLSLLVGPAHDRTRCCRRETP